MAKMKKLSDEEVLKAGYRDDLDTARACAAR